MSRSPFGLVYLAVDEPKGDPTQRRARTQLAGTDLHVSPYPYLHMRSYADNTGGKHPADMQEQVFERH